MDFLSPYRKLKSLIRSKKRKMSSTVDNKRGPLDDRRFLRSQSLQSLFKFKVKSKKQASSLTSDHPSCRTRDDSPDVSLHDFHSMYVLNDSSSVRHSLASTTPRDRRNRSHLSVDYFVQNNSCSVSLSSSHTTPSNKGIENYEIGKQRISNGKVMMETGASSLLDIAERSRNSILLGQSPLYNRRQSLEAPSSLYSISSSSTTIPSLALYDVLPSVNKPLHPVMECKESLLSTAGDSIRPSDTVAMTAPTSLNKTTGVAGDQEQRSPRSDQCKSHAVGSGNIEHKDILYVNKKSQEENILSKKDNSHENVYDQLLPSISNESSSTYDFVPTPRLLKNYNNSYFSQQTKECMVVSEHASTGSSDSPAVEMMTRSIETSKAPTADEQQHDYVELDNHDYSDLDEDDDNIAVDQNSRNNMLNLNTSGSMNSVRMSTQPYDVLLSVRKLADDKPLPPIPNSSCGDSATTSAKMNVTSNTYIEASASRSFASDPIMTTCRRYQQEVSNQVAIIKRAAANLSSVDHTLNTTVAAYQIMFLCDDLIGRVMTPTWRSSVQARLLSVHCRKLHSAISGDLHQLSMRAEDVLDTLNNIRVTK